MTIFPWNGRRQPSAAEFAGAISGCPDRSDDPSTPRVGKMNPWIAHRVQDQEPITHDTHFDGEPEDVVVHEVRPAYDGQFVGGFLRTGPIPAFLALG